MKKLALITTSLLLSTLSYGQLVSDETNAIHLDLGNSSEELVKLPEIEWVFPATNYTNSTDRSIAFKARFSSSSEIVDAKINFRREKDGKVIVSRTLDLPENRYQFILEQTMNLQDGENIISFESTNADGGKVESFRSVLVGFDAISKAIDINRKDYGLFIATDKYDHWSDLVNPVFDSETIAKELNDIYGFETELIADPGQEDILIKLKEYATRKYRPQDQLLIFIAGHGQFDESFGEGYLVTKGSIRDDPAKTTYIAHSTLRTYINNIPCDHILLVMDVCFSGTFDPVIAASRGDDVYSEINDSELLVRKLSKVTRRYLTSGGKEYVSDGIPGKHSPFAQRFLEVLRSRGGEDRIVTLTEMYPTMQRLKTLPRTGEFGKNEKDSDFVFVVK
jgi:hypothetical protein